MDATTRMDKCCAPAESWIGKHPVARGCGCCDLRAGTIAGCVFMVLYFVYETLVGGVIVEPLLGVLLPAGHDLAFLKMLPLFCGAAVYTFGAYHTFQRNTNQIHAVVRLQLGFAGCLVCCLPVVWLAMASRCERQRAWMGTDARCAAGRYSYHSANYHSANGSGSGSGSGSMSTSPGSYPVNATNCANSDRHASDYDCEWAEDTQQCLPVWTESMCEASYDLIEYTGLPALIGVVAYVAWMSHSFAVTVENGAGRPIDLSSAADSSAV